MQYKDLLKMRRQAKAYLKKFIANGGRLTQYTCCNCGCKIPTPIPEKNQVAGGSKGYWDGAKACTNCGEVNWVKTWPSGKTEIVKLPMGDEQQTIDYYTKEILKMLGWKPLKGNTNPVPKYLEKERLEWFDDSHCLFHSDWNWIMIAKAAAQESMLDVYRTTLEYRILMYKLKVIHITFNRFDKAAIFQAIGEYAKTYNTLD